MQDEELTLMEKEEKWINAINRKNIDNIKTKEEYWYEIETYQKLFEDKYVLFTVEYGNEYGIDIKNDAGVVIGGRAFGELDACLDYPLKNMMFEGFEKEPSPFSAKTLREYMREQGFPITFKIWGD